MIKINLILQGNKNGAKNGYRKTLMKTSPLSYPNRFGISVFVTYGDTWDVGVRLLKYRRDLLQGRTFGIFISKLREY